MNSVRAILPSDAVVTVPTIHYFDDVAHVVIMDDCGVGGVTLKQLMLENPPPVSVAKALGAGLGEFLSRLHVWGRDPQTSNHASFDQNQQGRYPDMSLTADSFLPSLIKIIFQHYLTLPSTSPSPS